LDAVQVTTMFALAQVARLNVIMPLAVVADVKLPANSMKFGVSASPCVNVNDGVGVFVTIGAPGDINPLAPPAHPETVIAERHSRSRLCWADGKADVRALQHDGEPSHWCAGL
jgi:hypothetical protein